jgi:glucose-6-phosphate 1-epimerase
MQSEHPPVPGLSLGVYRGIQAWQVDTAQTRAVISVFGGQLLSWVPAGHEEVLWLSPQLASLPAALRGGVPLCWPWFGPAPMPGAPSHGRVRTQAWRLQQARLEDDGRLFLELQPQARDPDGLQLRQQLWIGRCLEQRLLTRHAGATALELGQALHSYFRVSDASRVQVAGVEGLEYIDKNADGRTRRQDGAWRLEQPHDPGRSDRIYRGGAGSYELLDPGLQRRIRVRTGEGDNLVIWNPGQAAAATMADVGPHWSGFVCVEAAHAGPDARLLQPGHEVMLGQHIEVATLTAQTGASA